MNFKLIFLFLVSMFLSKLNAAPDLAKRTLTVFYGSNDKNSKNIIRVWQQDDPSKIVEVSFKKLSDTIVNVPKKDKVNFAFCVVKEKNICSGTKGTFNLQKKDSDPKDCYVVIKGDGSRVSTPI